MERNTQIEQAVSSFAKTNKIGKSKVQQLIDEVIASIPKGNKPERISNGKQGRPVLEKTAALHQDIIQTVNNGFKGQRSAVLVRDVIGCDKVQFNNAIAALVKQGKLFHVGKAKTGSRGRQPFILSTSKPE